MQYEQTGNCHDNAVAESFFQPLKRERIKRRGYKNRETARQDIFNYIEMSYNPVRRHGHNGNRSPVEFEKSLLVIFWGANKLGAIHFFRHFIDLLVFSTGKSAKYDNGSQQLKK